METGPHTFMGSSEYILKLVRELDLEGSLDPASPVAGSRYIFRDGRLLPLPTSFINFIRTPLLSTRAKLRLTLEPLIPNGAQPNETAWAFFVRRFGEEAATYIMSPFISGIYAGNAKVLGARASFPKFWNFEHDSGSMIIGAAKFMLAKRKRLAREGVKQPKGLFSFKHGLGAITQTLAEKLPGSVRTGVQVDNILRRENAFVVKSKISEWTAPAIVLATPPSSTANLLAQIAPEAAASMKTIPMSPVAVLHWSQPGNGFPPGFGFLMPRLYDLRVLGTLFPSQLFAGRAPADQNLFASFYGGMLDPDALKLNDAALTDLLLAEHSKIFGMAMQKPEMIKILRYDGAIPQLLPDHPEKIAGILQNIDKAPGIFLAGNYLTGVGVEHAVTSGYLAAEQAFAFLSSRPKGRT